MEQKYYLSIIFSWFSKFVNRAFFIQQTNRKITKILNNGDITNDTVLALINTISIDNKYEKPFDNSTEDINFKMLASGKRRRISKNDVSLLIIFYI